MGGRGAIGNRTGFMKLPALTGTEKQIKWAEEIRKEAIKIFKQEAVLFDNQGFKEKYKSWKEKENKEAYSLYDNYQKMINESSASKWIDRRKISSSLDIVEKNKLDKAKDSQKKGKYVATINYIQDRYGFYF